MNKLAFIPLLLIIGSVGAYAQTPESYYNQTKLYDNQKSNSEITVSIDKSTYLAKDTINVIGIVSNVRPGYAVNLSVVDSFKKTIEHVSVTTGSSGFFTVGVNLPDGIASGTYTLVGYYGDKGDKSSVTFNVVGNEKQSSVVIPFGANVEFNKLNLVPQIFRAKTGEQITWLNNDGAVHTLASGTVGAQNRIFIDGKFDTGVISPSQTATITLFIPGNYTYFDPAYPWLVGKLIVTGSANQIPTPGQGIPMSDDYLSITTTRYDLESSEKTLFNDNMASVFKTWKETNSSTIALSNDNDTKIGKNSLRIHADTKNGLISVFYDYSDAKLQDWSNYNYLNFWLKGQNTGKSLLVGLLDKSWKSSGRYTLVDDSSDWKKVQIPLYTAYQNMDLSKVRGLEIIFNKGTTGEFKIDDIQIISEGKKTLFNENISPLFKTWTQSNSSTVTISDVTDAKVGAESLSIQVETKSGLASTYYDYSAAKLQDWSNYNYLNFWLKGQNTGKSLLVGLLDKSWKSSGRYTLVDDSSDWKKVQIPLYTAYQNMDLSKVRGLEIIFNKGTTGEFKIDDIALSIKDIEPKLGTNTGTYISGETIFVAGNVMVREGNSAVSIRVFNPNQSIVTVNQLIPKVSSSFGFTLHVSGNQFNEAGVYKILAQYGLLEHKADTSFTVINPKLAETYKDFGIYHVANTFYAIPQTQGDFNINRIEAAQYSTILTNSTLDNIKKAIDEIVISTVIQPPPIVITVPPPPTQPSFPVPNWVLFQIWQERKDLQSSYPEVKQGNLTNLKIWAENVGWNQEPRLAALIPEGEIPEYLIQNKTSTEIAPPSELNPNLIQTLQVAAAVIAVAIGGVFGYKFYRSKKKLPTSTS